MCRSGGEDLDVARLREIGEGADEVATEASLVRLAQAAIRTDVEIGELGSTGVLCVGEAPNVLLGAQDLIVDVLERADVDVTVAELLDEHRREPDDDAIRDLRVAKIVEEHEQRQICAEHRLVDPLLTVRPPARAAAPTS